MRDTMPDESVEHYSDRLDALGLMVGGITHDLNNLIGLILGFGELLEEETSLSEEGKNFVQKIVSASEKAAGLLAFIGRFSQRRANQRTSVSHTLLLEKSLILPETEIRAQRKQIIVSEDTLSDDDQVFVDEILMAGAISRIILFLSKIPSSERTIRVSGDVSSEMTLYRFTVPGCELSASELSQFLSTDIERIKAADEACSNGSSDYRGMTLTIARAIVEYHQGRLEAVDGGFRLILPVHGQDNPVF